MDQAFYGVSIKEIRKIVFEYAERKAIKHIFNK